MKKGKLNYIVVRGAENRHKTSTIRTALNTNKSVNNPYSYNEQNAQTTVYI